MSSKTPNQALQRTRPKAGGPLSCVVRRPEGVSVAKAFALRLTPDEQLVLYHFLFRYTARHEYSPENAGEDAVLWRVCQALGDAAGVRPAAESADYDALVAAARERVYAAEQSSAGGRGGRAEPGAAADPGRL